MLPVCCTILYINSYSTKFIWETKRKWIVWIVRETLHVNEKKNCRALHIDYTPFLGCLESFMTNLENKIKKKIKPTLKKKKKKKLNHIDCKIAYESMTI